MIRNILLALIVAINLYFIIYFLRDLFKNKQNFKEEPGDMRLLPFTSFITFFLSTFGVSDFAIGTVLYPKLKWVMQFLHWEFVDPDSIPVCGFQWNHWSLASA